MVLPVFLQAPWVHLQPISACLFSFVILAGAIALDNFFSNRWEFVASLMAGVSASWLGGCLFWGWLREYPLWHLPVEAIALPIALLVIGGRWRIGAAFYLASLLGTAFTDLMMLATGVMDSWPKVVKASFLNAPDLLNETANKLLTLQSIFYLILAAVLILIIARWMRFKSHQTSESASAWMVASAALTTTLWVDGLFLITALLEPKLSGLI